MKQSARRRRTKGLIPWMGEKLTFLIDRVKTPPELDWPLLLLCLAASVIGVIAIFSAGMKGSTIMGAPREAVKQGLWLGVSLVVFWLTAGMKGEGIKRWANIMLIACMALTLLTFVPGLGKTENSQTLWLDLGLVSLQPAEMLKLASLLAVALAFSQMTERPVYSPPYRDFPEYRKRFLWPLLRHNRPLITGFICAGLVLSQQDMATACVILVCMVAMYIVSGVSNWQIARLIVLFAVMGLAFGTLASYRVARVKNWVNRYDPAIINQGGFQQTRSEWAIVKGGWTGRGLTKGTIKKSLPTATSDFVMATVAEESGLLGVWAIIGLMGAISVRMLMLGARASAYGRLVCTGAGVWVAAQTAINICMVNATIPAVGLPMPFVTYGGSSLVVLWILMGAVTAVSRSEKEKKRVAADSDGWGHGRTRLSRA